MNPAQQLLELEKQRKALLQQMQTPQYQLPQPLPPQSQPNSGEGGGLMALLPLLPSVGVLVSRAVGQQGIAKCKAYSDKQALAGFKEAFEGDDELARIANMFYLRFFDVLKFGVNKKAPEAVKQSEA